MNIDSAYLPFLLDGAIVLVIVAFVLYGLKRGLILSLASILVLVVSMMGASLGANALTDPLTTLISPQVALAIEAQTLDSFPEMIDSEGRIFLDQVNQTLSESDTLASALAFLGIDQTYLETFLSTSSATASSYRPTVFQAIATTITAAFVSMILWIVIFVVLMLVLTLIVHALDLAARLPAIRQLNAAGGAVFGLIEGMVLVFIALVVAEFFGLFPDADVLEQTFLLPLFRNPMPTLVAFANAAAGKVA